MRDQVSLSIPAALPFIEPARGPGAEETMRTEFSSPAKNLLAQRAGHRCSNPTCRRQTAGPADTPNGAVNLGVAAHITAASAGGPRFDAHLTPEERASATNGIWLCQWCAKLIDSDTARYTLRLLRGWKEVAEATAQASLVDPGAEDRQSRPLIFSSTRDPEAIKIMDFYLSRGYTPTVQLSNNVDSWLRRGCELGIDPETGREVHFVFEAGAIREVSVLLVRPSQNE